MAKRSLSEQLNDAIEQLLSREGITLHAQAKTAVPRVPNDLRPLLQIAAHLRGLPREDFKSQLQSKLERSMTMSSAAKPAHPGYRTVTPYITVPQAPELVEFVRQAFGGHELLRTTGSAGGLHIEVQIGDSLVMIGGGGEGSAWRGTPMPTSLHLYVTDADAVYRRALVAGATSIEEPTDQPYGDREAGVKDLAGNLWWIATRKSTGHAPEGMRCVTPFLFPPGALKFIDFVQRAFGAEKMDVFQAPDGRVLHAAVKIGDSVIEMGEPQETFQPMPTTFYLSVDNVDEVYRRALDAGATSISEPADQKYGARVGGVKDLVGNLWYIAAEVKK